MNAGIAVRHALLLITLIILPVSVIAGGIVVGGTRVIYHSDKKEAAVPIKNNDSKNPFLIQSWVDTGDNKTRGPFIVTPPLFRIDPLEDQVLRVTKTGAELQQDRESVYYLNVRAIPNTNKSATNELKLVVKTRIKLFYRPASLTGNASESYKQLTFVKSGNHLKIHNPTAWFVVFDSLRVGKTLLDKAEQVSPFGDVEVDIPVTEKSNVIRWAAINDYGGVTELQVINM